MEIPKTFDPSTVEGKWYSAWLESKCFKSEPDHREPFVVVIPPPNVTGVLHMGHALNNTIQDVLIRQERMNGKNACWVPGVDHASIATEAKVVALLAEEGLTKNDIGREAFLDKAFEWKNKYGNIILDQLKKLGASCDWDRTAFTMDPQYYASVIKVFNLLYEKDLIYKGEQMVNWDPVAKTAVSDEEVNHREVQSKLYYIRYDIVGEPGETITIATTRPETLLGDTAICVHPEDERYQNWIGKRALVPFTEREVPIIADEYVEKDFGTGALKVTPAHDKNDLDLGHKHGLEMIDVFTPEGKMAPIAGRYVGDDRFVARKKIAKDLEAAGKLEKVEEIVNSLGYSERTDAVIEPRLSTQWFCRMHELAAPALEAVMADEVEFYPAKFKNVYRHWMENIRDWCISRQLWWGQRIPVWYLPDGRYVVAENEQEALVKAQALSGDASLSLEALRQDDDVLDTWFSSWLWPVALFNGILEPDNADIEYYYPTNVLVTGHDIIFFWVARMIMAGKLLQKAEPFHEVYFTGMVRDDKGRKMSKSLGNSPDLLELIKIYGADGTRFGILVASPAGNDLLYDNKLCEQGRNFSNKIWNAFRLVKGWESSGMVKVRSSKFNEKPVLWFKNKLQQVLHDVDDHIEEYRLSEALTLLYKLIWDDFCSAYLEMIKPTEEIGMDVDTYSQTVEYFSTLMQALHPFMPFITEEVWQNLKEREEGSFCTLAQYPKGGKGDSEVLRNTEKIIDTISAIRSFRNENGMSPKEPIELYVRTPQSQLYRQWEPIMRKMVNIKWMEFVRDAVPNCKSFTIKTDEFYIPFAENLDVEAEKLKIESEIEYAEGFLKQVLQKLQNPRFVENAKPDVLEKENQKKDDTEAKIKSLKDALQQLEEHK